MQEFNDFLTGKCLISAPSGKEEGLFAKSVIYVCSHSKDGAMGFIINKKIFPIIPKIPTFFVVSYLFIRINSLY